MTRGKARIRAKKLIVGTEVMEYLTLRNGYLGWEQDYLVGL